jgi:hypothetical protein
MIRTAGRAPSIRIDATGSEIIARDPRTDDSCVIATNVVDNDWDRIDGAIWSGLARARSACPTDPWLEVRHASAALVQMYLSGMSALLSLVRNDSGRLNAIREFFGSRMTGIAEVDAQPPVIDVVTRQRHFPVEVLPLLRQADLQIQDPYALMMDAAETLPGYAAVIRRELLEQPRPQQRPAPTGTGLSVYPFIHDELQGSAEEMRLLGRLDSAGRLSLGPAFPPKGHRPKYPSVEELEVAILVSNPTPENWVPKERGALNVCHFSCHLRTDPEPVLVMQSSWRQERKYNLVRLHGASTGLNGVSSVLFLGTCRSGVQDRQTLLSAVDVFKAFIPVALVGTLCDVPDVAAGVFSSEFYRAFSSGSSVGASMRIARVNMLLKRLPDPYDGCLNNPFGLLFTSYLGEDTQPRTRQDERGRFVPNETEAIVQFPVPGGDPPNAFL